MAYQVGKRYACDSCGTTCLVSKPSADGELTCCGAPLTLQQPKQLASSD